MKLKSIVMFDQESRIKDPKENLNFITRCITDLFESFLETYETEDCKQLNFILGDFVEFKIDAEMDGFYDIEVPFDKSNFLLIEDSLKKRELARTLEKGLRFVSKEKGWDEKPFLKALDKMKEIQYKNQYYAFKHFKLNPSKTLKANVLCEFDLYTFRIFIEVYDRKKNPNLISKECIYETLPLEYEFLRLMHKLEWLNDNEVALYKNSHKVKYKSLKIN